MSEQAAKTKAGMTAEWVIKDKDGNIKEQGSEGTEEEGGGEEAEK
jgi:hypothetical protein